MNCHGVIITKPYDSKIFHLPFGIALHLNPPTLEDPESSSG